jgi:hypothetical protein
VAAAAGGGSRGSARTVMFSRPASLSTAGSTRSAGPCGTWSAAAIELLNCMQHLDCLAAQQLLAQADQRRLQQ